MKIISMLLVIDNEYNTGTISCNKNHENLLYSTFKDKCYTPGKCENLICNKKYYPYKFKYHPYCDDRLLHYDCTTKKYCAILTQVSQLELDIHLKIKTRHMQK